MDDLWVAVSAVAASVTAVAAAPVAIQYWRLRNPRLTAEVETLSRVHRLHVRNGGRGSAFRVLVDVEARAIGQRYDPIPRSWSRRIPLQEIPGGETISIPLHLFETTEPQIRVSLKWLDQRHRSYRDEPLLSVPPR